MWFGLILLVVVLVAVTLLFISNRQKQGLTNLSGKIDLQLIAEGFVSPVEIKSSPDSSGRLFVVDRIGEIKIINTDSKVLATPFLDIKNKLVKLETAFDERGFWGLAFHPKFKENGKFYVYYSAPLRKGAPEGFDHTNYVSEFTASKDPNKSGTQERVVLQIDEPQATHNGGQILFGPDDLLYIAVGDGGGANDADFGHPEKGNGQDVNTLQGSILRIDVNGDPYGIPADNPFVAKDGKDEIFAYGFRNPFRMSFDDKTGDLYVGDVGQNLWEEVDVVKKGGNYGWHVKEGSRCFDPKTPDNPPTKCLSDGDYTDPIIEYGHPGIGGSGRAVLGGFVYRGGNIPKLKGKYLFGDWSSNLNSDKGMVFVAEEKSGKWQMKELLKLKSYLLGFGKDALDELYILTTDVAGPEGSTGKVYKIIKK